mgnify:CR=1 FL=1
MKRIKQRLMNETKYRQLFRGNDYKIKNTDNNPIATDSNFYKTLSDKFGKTATNFNNNSNFRSRYFPNSLQNLDSSKTVDSNKLKKNLNYMKKNKSNSYNNKELLPFLNSGTLNFAKRNNLIMNNKLTINKINTINNYTNLTSLNSFKKKYKNNIFRKKELKLKEDDDDDSNQKNNYIDNYYNKKEKKNDEFNNKYKYSMILKNLDNWDKDHCDEDLKKSGMKLFNYLNDYYEQKNLKEDQNNLIAISNMLNTRRNYNNFLEEGKQKDKIFLDLMKTKQRETGSILKNNLYKTQLKFSQLFDKKYSKQFNDNFDIDSDTLNILIEDEAKDVYYNKLIHQRIKYENQLHNELLKINKFIFEKKNLKEQKTERLKNLFNEINELKKDYNEKYNENRKVYWHKYDSYEHHYKRLISNKNVETYIKLNEEGNEVENNENIKNKMYSKSPSPRKKSRRRMSQITKKAIEHIKEIEAVKNFQILNMNNQMNYELRKIHTNFQKKVEEINKEMKTLENEIKIIKYELEYYKQVNDELISEHRQYYMEKLKKGFDCRKDGLTWIVANLLELQVTLEYHHFPKFLTHEQIDYIKKVASLELKQREIKIIINVLKKKQSTQKMNDVLKCMDVIDNIIYSDNNNNSGEGEIKNLLNTSNKYFLISKNEVDKKFMKVYKDNINIMQNYFKKNLENYEFYNVIKEIKRDLYHGSNSAIQKSKKDVLNVFMGDQSNKSFFQFLLDIKSNYSQLDEEKEQLFQKEKENYLKVVESIRSHKASINSVIKYEMIKKCLFGTRLDK